MENTSPHSIEQLAAEQDALPELSPDERFNVLLHARLAKGRVLSRCIMQGHDGRKGLVLNADLPRLKTKCQG